MEGSPYGVACRRRDLCVLATPPLQPHHWGLSLWSLDERTLLLLGSRADNVACTIYTLKPESPKLAPALANYAIEYPTKPIEIKGFKKAHDRFLIIDDTLWHIGASLKDAGLNLFAMMKMTLSPDVILSLLPH